VKEPEQVSIDVPAVIPKPEVKPVKPTAADYEAALSTARIQQFYSMDDTKWDAHKKGDEIGNDWRFDLAAAASRVVLREYEAFLRNAPKLPAGSADSETASLHRMITMLCTKVFQVDEGALSQGAGGTDKRFGLNGVTWKPHHVLSKEDALAYFHERGVLEDYPLGQPDICTTAFGEYTRAVAYGGDLGLDATQTTFGLGTCAAVVNGPLVLDIEHDSGKGKEDKSNAMLLWPTLGLTLLPSISILYP